MEKTLGVSPMSATEMVLRDLGYRYSRGERLSFSEESMAMTAAAAMNADRFGPGPATMKLQPPDLPETVKGALAQYSA